MGRIFPAGLIFFIALNQSLGQDGLSNAQIESRIDSAMTELEEAHKDNIEIYERSKDNLEMASKIIDYTALFFTVLSGVFLVTGFIGFQSLSGIRKARSQIEKLKDEMEGELANIKNIKNEIGREIALLKEKIESESKDFLKTVYLLNEGITNYYSGKLTEAEKKFIEILNINENDYEATYLLARCYFGQGKYSLALETINKAIGLSENPGKAYFILAENYRRLKDFDKSIEAFNKAILYQKDYATFSSLGYTYLKKGEYDLAIRAFRDALEIKRYSTPTGGLAKALVKKGKIKEAKKYIEETILLAEEEIAEGTRYAWPYFNLSFGLLVKNKRLCIKTLRMAIEKSENIEVIKEPYLDYKDMIGEEVPQELLLQCIALFEEKLELG